MDKTYIAYAIYDVELPSGFVESRFIHAYDSSGINYKRFTSYEEAKEAAIALMKKYDCDRWNVI